MYKSLMSWLGQVTTGHGVMILVPTLLSAMTGAMTWEAAAPLLVAGVIGLVWPENMGLRATAQTAAADIVNVVRVALNKSGSTMPGTAPSA